MAFNISRLNISERDIEDWLFDNPQAVSWRGGTFEIERWVARQYRLPSGIADLIGWTKSEHVVAVEVKNVPADSKALAQVSRYAHDIQYIIERHWGYRWGSDQGPYVPKLVIAPSVDSQTTLYEANALNVSIELFSVSLDIRLSRAPYAGESESDQHKDYWGSIESIAKDKVWDMLGPFTSYEDESKWDREAREREMKMAFMREMLCAGGDTEHF